MKPAPSRGPYFADGGLPTINLNLLQEFIQTTDVFWTREQIKKLITIFPEGQVVTVVDDKIVGCALSIIVDYDKVKNADHTYAFVTGNETFNTHNQEQYPVWNRGLYHPDYRGLRLAWRMAYDYRKELCESLNLKAIMFGGRIPNYHKYADTMRPKNILIRSVKKFMIRC